MALVCRHMARISRSVSMSLVSHPLGGAVVKSLFPSVRSVPRNNLEPTDLGVLAVNFFPTDTFHARSYSLNAARNPFYIVNGLIISSSIQALSTWGPVSPPHLYFAQHFCTINRVSIPLCP